MSEMNDYQLEEMENSQIKKANTAKKAAILAAGGLGLTATGAFAADRISDMTEDENNDNVLTEDDLITGAEAASLEEPVAPAPAPEPEPAPEPAPAPAPEPIVEVGESGIAFDADGNLIAQYDSGTVGGDRYMVMDTDFNGKGDLLAVDANNNNRLDVNEVLPLDNESYTMAPPTNVAIVDIDRPYPDPNPDEGILAHEDNNIDDISNDFYSDDTTGENYRHDLADNNPDYRNDADTEYYAGENTDDLKDPYDPDAEYDPMAGYDVDAHNENLADNDTFDDNVADDAFVC